MAKTKPMKLINSMTDYFISDLILDAAKFSGFGNLAKKTKLDFGIEKSAVVLTDKNIAKEIGKPLGKYATFDTKEENLLSDTAVDYLSTRIAKTLANLAGVVKWRKPILVLGLGNEIIAGDSLGAKAVDLIKTTRAQVEAMTTTKQNLCAFKASVYGKTGIRSSEVATAFVKNIQPELVILVDSLATSTVSRVGCSFQISNTGITPGSGVSRDKDAIDKDLLGVDVISIGVPLMLNMSTLLYSFAMDYADQLGAKTDVYKLRSKLQDGGLGNLIVAPKDIDVVSSIASKIIANSITKAFL